MNLSLDLSVISGNFRDVDWKLGRRAWKFPNAEICIGSLDVEPGNFRRSNTEFQTTHALKYNLKTEMRGAHGHLRGGTGAPAVRLTGASIAFRFPGIHRLKDRTE